ncbi:DMT family transporter [Persicimonas caeni]|uniref:DMT family transporter n=1 Tax=Persicimonas caeni TaxID=2292766 RepID=A0A4Y6Q097_PERCE|nr:DMT family transporter [Persicimonas caeni]QDG54001.1 DMT family transporter [Persicimonas caeni]QED35222.1 DMT family transporter [Persicimonas caeni]
MGEIAALSASALWATASLMFARLGKSIGPLVINILKCVIALALMFVVLLVLDGRLWPAGLSTFETGMLALSGLAGLTLGDTAYFNALNRLGPRRTLLLAALTPPMTAIMAVFVLDEPITFGLLVGMGLTLGGVVWVILERHPGDDQVADVERDEADSGLSGAEKAGIGFGILAAFGQAAGNVLTKLGGSEITALEISIVRLAFGIGGLAIVLGAMGRLARSAEPLRDGRTFALLFAATFLGTFLGIWLMNAGLRYTYTGIASTLSSTSPIFILPLAYFIEKEKLSARSILGACVAVVGVAVLFLG